MEEEEDKDKEIVEKEGGDEKAEVKKVVEKKEETE